jgi:anti-sigma regulatory factor (Ser/Thr protein kinase)
MRVELPGDVHAAAAARRFVATALADLGEEAGSPPPDDVMLVVSELVTNSVRAGAGLIDVELTVTDDRVDLSVTDGADGWPATRHPALDDPHGRGLAIVESIADEWHPTLLDPGKRVTATWFRVVAGHVG